MNMWPFKKTFQKGLAERAGTMHVTRQTVHGDDGEGVSLSVDFEGFLAFRKDHLGELAALILAQAQSDGASRVQLYYGNTKMVYTVKGTDYDMLPCPAPMNVDLVRAFAKASGMTSNHPGLLKVAFADATLSLNISHPADAEDPCLEITGFTGVPRRASAGTQGDPHTGTSPNCAAIP